MSSNQSSFEFETAKKPLKKMEKIINEVGGGEGSKFNEEFLKAQKKIMDKFPSLDHLKEIIDSLKDITEEEKEKLKKNLGERAFNAEKMKNLIKNKKLVEGTLSDYALFIGMIVLVLIVIGEEIFLSTRDSIN